MLEEEWVLRRRVTVGLAMSEPSEGLKSSEDSALRRVVPEGRLKLLRRLELVAEGADSLGELVDGCPIPWLWCS